MRKTLVLVGMELKYLFRQKFLWLLVLFEIMFLIYCLPKERAVSDYDAIDQYNLTHSLEKMSEEEKIIINFLEYRKTETEKNRISMAQKASEKKERLTEEERYEKEYLETIEKYYGTPVQLEIQNYLGWETFFLGNTSMSPYNISAFINVFIIAASGVLLFVKDKENNTLFWASLTGKGMGWFSYLLKIFSIFLYAVLIHIIFFGVEILGLKYQNYDMRHWFHSIQNIPQYAMCDLQINMVETILINIVINFILSISIALFVLLFARILKKYVYLFVGVLIVEGGLFYNMLVMFQEKNYDIWWRLNLFSSFQLDKFLTYDAVNIGNHAVDVRGIVFLEHTILLVILVVCSYQIWRKYLYES